MNEQPAAIVGTITAAVAAVIALVVAFGIDLTPDQQAAILSVAAVAAPLIAALFIRLRVWSPASHEAVIQRVRRVEATARNITSDAPSSGVDPIQSWPDGYDRRPPLG